MADLIVYAAVVGLLIGQAYLAFKLGQLGRRLERLEGGRKSS